MKQLARDVIALMLAAILVLAPLSCAHRTKPPNKKLLAPAVFKPLQDAMQKSYLELFQEAPGLEFSQDQIDQMRTYLDQAQDYCVGQFKQHADQYEGEMKAAQSELKKKTHHLDKAERHNLHCRIQNLRSLKSQANVLAEHAIPVAYANKQAKLDLIEDWPGELKKVKQEIATGAYHNREYGDVKDIGFREIAPGQEDDIKEGQDAIRQMKQSGLMPPELKNDAINTYVTNLAKKIAAHSDLQVPVHVTVLNSKEINAFALPGGFVFVQRGLLEAADDESELAGVLAHEIAHAADRHGHKLMKKATIASIIYQSAQVAALVLTGGVAGIGTYYALRYGFYGLGLVLDLKLLGVSREFEEQADILGIQYCWNSGYDPDGFIRFFDKMASKEGYVNGASWFRTHPPFYQRMVASEREIMFLPKKEHLITQTKAFENMKKELAKVTAKAKEEEKGKPSLKAPEQGCAAPEKIEYKPDEPVETICSNPPITQSGKQSSAPSH